MIAEVCVVTIALFFVLYGLIQAAVSVGMRLFRPEAPQTALVLWLEGEEDDMEEKVRYARLIASNAGMPLVVVNEHEGDGEHPVLNTMFAHGGGVLCNKADLQNIVSSACAGEQKRV